MQALTWYLKRLGAMTGREIGWRVHSHLRDRADRLLLKRRGRPRSVASLCRPGESGERVGFRVCGLPVGAWGDLPGEDPRHAWRTRLIDRADRIAEHRLSFFDLRDHHLGDPIDWNRDHSSGVAAPMTFAPSIDYRDVRVTGDCKYVWELNRHHQWVVLGRAYRATGDDRYARAVAAQLDSWLAQCPYGIGMQWRSGLELAVRLINWVYAVDMIAESGLIVGELRRRLLEAVNLHLWEISRKYSRGSSANNHLIGEAAGVFVASGYFASLSRAAGCRAESRRILCDQVRRQFHADGGSAEQAIGYHRFALQLLLAAGVSARRTGRDFPAEYWSVLERMLEFHAGLSEGGPVPMLGDCDDGYVLDLGCDGRAFDGWVAAAAALLQRSDGFDLHPQTDAEPAHWLVGAAAAEALQSNLAPPSGPIASRAFRDTGYYLLQCGRRGSPDRISVGVDCGPMGLGSIAAHGHADALSITLRAFGEEVLVDPGTYDYFSYPRWRDYFRSTRAHNTVEVDRRDQSEPAGPFMWSNHAESWCDRWEPTADGGCVVGEHAGYTRLSDPVVHRRTVGLSGCRRTVTIRDEIIAGGPHELAVCLHFAEHCRVTREGPNGYRVRMDGGEAVLQMDRGLTVEQLEGSTDPIGGWVSRGYHHRTAVVSLIGRGTCRGSRMLMTRISIGEPAG